MMHKSIEKYQVSSMKDLLKLTKFWNQQYRRFQCKHMTVGTGVVLFAKLTFRFGTNPFSKIRSSPIKINGLRMLTPATR